MVNLPIQITRRKDYCGCAGILVCIFIEVRIRSSNAIMLFPQIQNCLRILAAQQCPFSHSLSHSFSRPQLASRQTPMVNPIRLQQQDRFPGRKKAHEAFSSNRSTGFPRSFAVPSYTICTLVISENAELSQNPTFPADMHEEVIRGSRLYQ